MFVSIEEFFKAHQYTIAAIAAVGTVLAGFATVAAVLASLYLARRSERVRLKASFAVGLSNTSPSVQYAIIRVTNVGMREAWLPILFFEWRLPFRRKQQPETMANWINAILLDNPKREIKVGQDAVFSLGTMEVFRKKMTEEYRRMATSLNWFEAARIKRLGARIYTQDGSQFPVVFARAIREELSTLITKLPRSAR